MTAEWKPTNPRGDCNSKLKGESCKYYLECNDLRIFEGEVTGQTKLLEYLIDYCHKGNHIGIEVDGVSRTTLTKMLTELESGK